MSFSLSPPPLFQERNGRTLYEKVIEGDIVIRNGDLADLKSLNGHLVNPDRLWPDGLVSSGESCAGSAACAPLAIF